MREPDVVGPAEPVPLNPPDRSHDPSSWRAAFNLGEREHIALVGGGGKTTTLWSMARELSQRARVVVTSTTKAGAPAADVPLVLWEPADPSENLRAAVADAFARSALVAVGSAVRKERLQSVAPVTADFLFEACRAGYVLNEADGARMLPFKAPAAHEPLLASTTTLAIVVVGLDALGKKITEAELHRPELIAAAAGARPGDALEPAHVAAVVRAYLEKFAVQAPGARAAVLVNKIDADAELASASDVAAAFATLPLVAVVGARQSSERQLWRLR